MATLSPRFQYNSDRHSRSVSDYGVYLAILAGDDVEADWRTSEKVEEADPETVGTYPAEVFINLLLRSGVVGGTGDCAALLAGTEDRRLTCPGVLELCQRTGDYGRSRKWRASR